MTNNQTRIRRTRSALRLFQNGTLLSHLRMRPGPTHELFDVLAACIHCLSPGPKVTVLGFSAGGIMAPLRGMYGDHHVDALDTDEEGWKLFLQSAESWKGSIRFYKKDACGWMQQTKKSFDAVLEDVSSPLKDTVIKPPICLDPLPRLSRERLTTQGVYIANWFPPLDGSWKKTASALGIPGKNWIHCIHLEDYHNRVLISGNHAYSTRELSFRLMCSLDIIRSKQADRFWVRKIRLD